MMSTMSYPSPSAVAGYPVPPSLDDEHSMGTTIIAVEFDGGVVLGADSRTSTGSYVANRVSDKLTPVSDRIYCCRSGSAADTQAISQYVKYYLDLHKTELGREPDVQTAASLFQQMCYQNKDNLMAGIICAGWDRRKGGQVYSIPLGGSLLRQPFTMSGSGSLFVYGLVDAEFRTGMTEAECKSFVTKAISRAITRDGSSGGVIRLATITEGGVKREFIPNNKIERGFEE
eukprot:TRINITY_DN11619_c0_g1::TRINITY_DN11619_c0_g1_i1::g.22101::m.22101 TRINITY_DN11619_c0_g1::TRINITY_DN11619_c0_g1_i1::g.22101  ORF type:complete len:244 (+),score=23.83,sp/Q55GJ6/PSB6_DICDI/60.48/3e-95,Proteasome/PF00227.21/1.6e-45 TRINITY_DN11619_c0_g1_i1:43-732(+)